MKNKSCIIIIAIIISLHISGCLGPVHSHPQPSGPSLSAGNAISLAEKELMKIFRINSFTFPLSFQNISSPLCRWSGKDAGNSSFWEMNFTTIISENDSNYYIEGWMWIGYNESGQFQIKSGYGYHLPWAYSTNSINLSACGRLISINNLNMTLDNIIKSDYKIYISKFDSPKVVLAAQNQRQKSDSITGLYMIAHNTLAHSGSINYMAWEITWTYENALSKRYDETVVLRANDLSLLYQY